MNAMRERRYLTFDMNDPRHRQALALFSARSSKQRSEYIISCILKAEQGVELKEAVRSAIFEALKGVSLAEQAEPEKAAIESIGELPGALLSMLDEI